MKVFVLAALASCLLLTTGLAAPADASMRKATNIPAESLSDALRTLAKDRQFEILYRAEVVRDVRTGGAIGEFTSEEALKAVLSGTGLSYKYLDANTVTVFPQSSSQEASGQSNAMSNGSSESSPKEVGKKSSQDFRLAQLAQASAGPSTLTSPNQNSANSQSAGPALTEIIVTAEKREERLLDVPVPVTAINAQTLVDRNEVRLQDFYTSVPGLNLTIGQGAEDAPVLSIRGITTGGSGFGGNPTVGVLVDDVPYGSSTSLGGGNLVPDIDPSDLARVEVLRGPQGTLYGASSIGGLLKYVTVDPSTDSLSGRIQAGVSSVYNGGETGYNVRGAVNVPLSDTIAVRASGYTRLDPGYIDDPGLGVTGVNRGENYGGRLAGLWRPLDTFSLKLSAVLQHSETDGSAASWVQPGLGDLQQNFVLPGLGGYTRDSYVYSAIAKAKLGDADLIAISGYTTNKVTDSFDRTAAFGTCAPGSTACTEAQYGVDGAQFLERFKTNRFTQEVRLSVPIAQHVDWLLGAYYTHETSQFVQDIDAIDPTNLATVGVPYHNPFQGGYQEYAAFTDVTFHFTDWFDVQVGGRESQNKQDLSALFEGVFIPLFYGFPSGHTYPDIESKDNSFTYLVTPEFKVTPDLMVYARFASGYRPGGPNSNATAAGVPSTFGPDTTRNYELGAKGDFLDHMLSFDASIYYIDWKNIQLQLSQPVTSFAYFANAGGAKSQGIELSGEVRPWTGMTVGAWVAWDDAILTSDFPPGPSYGVSGNRLPFSSRFSGNLSLQQEFPVVASVSGFVGGSLSYVGDRQGVFTGTPQRQDYPSYAQTDLRAGAKYGTWEINSFVNNVADKRGILAGGLGTAVPYAFYYVEPRTIGVSFSKTF